VEGNWLYLASDTSRADERHAPEIESAAVQRLTAALDWSSADRLAIDAHDELGIEL